MEAEWLEDDETEQRLDEEARAMGQEAYYQVDAKAITTRAQGMRRAGQPLGAPDWAKLAKALQERLADELDTVTDDDEAVDDVVDLCWAIAGAYQDFVEPVTKEGEGG